jgi:excisionase family DNA binding protein
MSAVNTATQTRFITTRQAAELVGVEPRTILNWIRADKIPYIELPSSKPKRKDYRIPLRAFVDSLAGTYDMADELRAFDRTNAKVTDEDVARFLDN